LTAGSQGRLAEPGIPLVIGTLSGQALAAYAGSGQIRVSGPLYDSV
jgi:hypothetical protein